MSDKLDWPEEITTGVWDRPAIETREEFKAAISAALDDARREDRAEIERLREELDHEHEAAIFWQSKAVKAEAVEAERDRQRGAAEKHFLRDCKFGEGHAGPCVPWAAKASEEKP